MSDKTESKLTVSRFARPGQQFTGRKDDFTEYKQGLTSMISCNDKTSADGKYIFEVYPEDVATVSGYRIPQQYRVIPVPVHWRATDLVVNPMTAAEKKSNEREIAEAKEYNEPIIAMNAAILGFIYTTVNEDILKALQKFGGNPYTCYRFMAKSYGDESLDQSEQTSYWNAYIDDQMPNHATFSLALSEFETKATALKLTPTVKLLQLRTHQKNNEGKRQFLPDRLLDDLKHTERLRMSYEDTVRHLTAADNAQHISNKELANPKKGDSRGNVRRVTDATAMYCYNCGNTGHQTTGCKSNWCGHCQ